MISTKGRYALRVMIDLAEQAPEAFIPLDTIAARQGISKKYLESILKILVQKKLLKGLRGKGGGYRLTRRAEEYTVGEILELTEGTLAPVACLEAAAEPCPRTVSYTHLFGDQIHRRPWNDAGRDYRGFRKVRLESQREISGHCRAQSQLSRRFLC